MKKVFIIWIVLLILFPAVLFAGDRHGRHSHDREHRHHHLNPWEVTGAAVAGAIIYDLFAPRYHSGAGLLSHGKNRLLGI